MIKLFIPNFKYFLITVFLLAGQGCSSIPNGSYMEGINTTMSPNIIPTFINGSLFKDTKLSKNYGYKPLFEDHRPHNIGDTVTIVLQENINARNSSTSQVSRDGNANAGIELLTNQLNANLKDNSGGLSTTGRNDFSGRGSYSANNNITGFITVTVQNILPNGNLKVRGEKRVAINDGVEFIRFAGVINPININKNNLIASTQVADLRIEYLSNDRSGSIQGMGWLQRLLLKFSPI